MAAKKWGWIPQLHDHRDLTYTVSEQVPLPPEVDLRPQMPPVYDQGPLGSCTGNAIAGAFHYDLIKQGLQAFTPSRLFIYFNERRMEGTVNSDAGAVIRDGIKSIAQWGVCPENLWPYITERFAIRPPSTCYKEALQNKAVLYRALRQLDIAQMQQALANGNPFVFGFSVYESFESQAVASTGIVPVPQEGEALLGGHAVLCVGYKAIDNRLYFIVRNSWGVSWGDAGYFYMPSDYIGSYKAADFWVVNKVS